MRTFIGTTSKKYKTSIFCNFLASILSERNTIERKKSIEKGLEKEQDIPPDPYRLVYFIFFFFGLGTMLPMSFFLTAQQVR